MISAATLELLVKAGIQGEALIEIARQIESDQARWLGFSANDAEPEARERSNAAERQARYRERRKLAGAEWAALREAAFVRDAFICQYCEADVRDDPHCDHYIPLIHGGTNDLSNLKTSCGPCNFSKSGKHPDDWSGRA